MFSQFIGLEIWNTKTTSEKNVDYDNCNPFPWSPDPSWDSDLRNGIAKWDSLLIANLNNNLHRKISVSGGSDAHGAFNYTLTRPFYSPDISATDNAFGKVRTAVYCPDGMGPNGENVVFCPSRGKICSD